MCLHFTPHSTMSTMLPQQILNPSKSIEYEPIEPTETQEDLPKKWKSTPGLHPSMSIEYEPIQQTQSIVYEPIQQTHSIEYEPIQQTQSIEYETTESTHSIEYVFETETQEDLPETPESITDDTDEIDEQNSVTWDSDKRCGNCWNIVTANPFIQSLKADRCASCGVHYEHYLYHVVVKPSQRGRHKPATGRLVEVQFKIPSLNSAFKEYKANTFDIIREHDREVSLNLKPVYGFSPCMQYRGCDL